MGNGIKAMPYATYLQPLLTKLHAWWQRQLAAASTAALYVPSQDEDEYEYIWREDQARVQLRETQARARRRAATAKAASHVDSKGRLHGFAPEGGA